ncbi:MAG: hypothetical protein GY839_21710 [candidate division Zixibacteria bacterium]|nr:hypothetical protein [candidate division Zixibacteria bacterium]
MNNAFKSTITYRAKSILIYSVTAFCLIWFKHASADDQALVLADYLFDSENYYEAVTEYQRYIFFNPDDEYLGDVHRRIGLAYRNMGQWQSAKDAIRKSIYTAADDSIRDERKIDLAVVLISSGNYSAAEMELLRLSYFSSYPSLKQRASFFLAVSCIYAYKWEEARVAFRDYTGNPRGLSPANANADSSFKAAVNLKLKSPGLAKTLSTFLPGSGQIYAGGFFNGLNALLLNSAMGYFVIDGLANKEYGDALVRYFLTFFRYYRGNRENAYNLALDYNEKLNRQQAGRILQELKKSID